MSIRSLAGRTSAVLGTGRLRHLSGYAAALCLVSSCTYPQSRPSTAEIPLTSGDLAFVGASVIPMDTEQVLTDQTVVVTGTRISRIGNPNSIRLSPATRVIDARGKFLIPGLADMHVHIMSDAELPLFVANGVTTVRIMSGSKYSLDLRSRVDNCEILGPSVITAGPMLDGSPKLWPDSEEVTDPEQGRQLVREQKAAGYDFIKVYSNLTPQAFRAIAEESKASNIPFAGHIPRSMDAADAMRAGMESVEHLTGLIAASVNLGFSIGSGFLSPEMNDIAERVVDGKITMDDVFSSAKIRQLSEISRKSGAWQTPTLVALDRVFFTSAQQAAYLARPEIRYIPAATRSYWTAEIDYRSHGSSPKNMGGMRAFFDVDMRLVSALHAAGVGILVGTDSPNPFVLPGFSLYDELEFLERAGLSRFEAIAAATRNPAHFLKADGEFGVVAVGARADLILLDANPLKSLANLRARRGVMIRGQWLSESELSASLEQLAADDADKGHEGVAERHGIRCARSQDGH